MSGDRGWKVRRDHGGGWHHIVDGAGIVRAEVWGARNALAVCKFLAEHLGSYANGQTVEDVRDPMFVVVTGEESEPVSAFVDADSAKSEQRAPNVVTGGSLSSPGGGESGERRPGQGQDHLGDVRLSTDVGGTAPTEKAP